MLKNALDWLVSLGEPYGKPVAVLSAAPSDERGHYARQALAQTLAAQGARVVLSATVPVPPAARPSGECRARRGYHERRAVDHTPPVEPVQTAQTGRSPGERAPDRRLRRVRLVARITIRLVVSYLIVVVLERVLEIFRSDALITIKRWDTQISAGLRAVDAPSAGAYFIGQLSHEFGSCTGGSFPCALLGAYVSVLKTVGHLATLGWLGALLAGAIGLVLLGMLWQAFQDDAGHWSIGNGAQRLLNPWAIIVVPCAAFVPVLVCLAAVTGIEILLQIAGGGIEWGTALVASSIWAAAMPLMLQGQGEHWLDEKAADWIATRVLGRASE